MARWPGDSPRPRARIGILAGVALAAAVLAYAYSFYDLVRGYRLQPGTPPLLSSSAGRAALGRIALAAPWRVLEPMRADGVPRLRLDIEPRHFARIIEKRREALERRFLITEEDAFVPATLRLDGRSVDVRVRLKGDLSDHLLGDKWSFRVEVQGGDSVLGMRRFSLQAPYTRGFQAEPLFFDFLREQGILTPRYRIVDLRVNGRSAGRMALEEHFGNELLESQKRRAGVIVRFDEQYFYLAELAFMAMVPDYDNWRNAPLDVFGRRRVERDPLLREQAQLAFGMLRGLADEGLAPSQVLDVELWGRYLAACEIWSTPHMTHWNNLRFYLNPLTLRLEPIGFDADSPGSSGSGLRCAGGIHAMMARLLEDPELRRAFVESVREYSALVMEPSFERWVREREARSFAPLRGEFPWLEPHPIEALRRRAHELRNLDEASLARFVPGAPARPMPHRPDADYPRVVHARLDGEGAALRLELANAISLPVAITELWYAWQGEDGVERGPVHSVYHRLPPTPWPQKPARLRVEPPGAPPLRSGWWIEGNAIVQERSHGFRTEHAEGALEAPPLPEPDLASVLARHPFLEREGETSWLVAGPGRFEVAGDLVLPRSYALRLRPGTTLRFDADAMLLARGSLELRGSAEQPIVLEGRGEGWQGLAALGSGAEVHWSHVVVRGTRSPRRPGWGLTGGVTLRSGTVLLEDCVFDGSAAEDALNVVRSELTLRGLGVRGVASDAIDVDFCVGSIEGGEIARAGGDGIDVSGSRLEIEAVELRDVGDKGVSAGERSQVAIAQLRVDGAGVGVASKDSSRVEVVDSRFRDIGLAVLMAYVKKGEFGPAEIVASGLEIEGGARHAIAQRGSRVALEGREVEPEALDVDALYATGPMRK